MKPVESSLIHSAGHNGLRMRVQFHNGAVYEYAGFPLKLYNEMMESDSVGKHFNANKGKYPATCIRPATK